MATVVARSRTSARPPGRFTERVSRLGLPVRAGRGTLSQTSPTGFSGAAAAGPGDARDADPDVGAETRAGAVGERLGDLLGDRPVALDQLAPDARLRDLDVVGVGDDRRPSRTSEEPGRSVRRAASRPPVHDSAVAIVSAGREPSPRSSRRDLLIDRAAVLGEQRVAVALAHEPAKAS